MAKYPTPWRKTTRKIRGEYREMWVRWITPRKEQKRLIDDRRNRPENNYHIVSEPLDHLREWKTAQNTLQHLKPAHQVYFAHPMTMYNSYEEKEIEKYLEQLTKARIINPKIYKNKNMGFYLDKVRASDVIVFSSNIDESIGKGVFAEVRAAQKLNKQVFFIDPITLNLYHEFKITKFTENEEEADWNYYAHVKID